MRLRKLPSLCLETPHRGIYGKVGWKQPMSVMWLRRMRVKFGSVLLAGVGLFIALDTCSSPEAVAQSVLGAASDAATKLGAHSCSSLIRARGIRFDANDSTIRDNQSAILDEAVQLLNATAPVVISSEIIYNALAQSAEGDPRAARGFTERPRRGGDGSGNRALHRNDLGFYAERMEGKFSFTG